MKSSTAFFVAIALTGFLSTTHAATVTLNLRSSVGGAALPYTVGQGLKQGDVPSGKVLAADNGAMQFIVKNRWPDGSAKYAVLSGHVDLDGGVQKEIGLNTADPSVAGAAVSTTDLKGTGVSASVSFAPFGAVSWSGADWDAPLRTTISGPEMSSFTYRKPIGADTHLVAWLEVRAYKGGRVEVLPWIENGYLKVAGPTEKSGTAIFRLGSNRRFNAPLNLLNHQRAVLASGTTLTHWYGSHPGITPKHDTAYLMATKLVPNYRGVTPSGSSLFTRLAQAGSYTPLMQANYPEYMPGTGYAPSIGLLPEWDVAYLTTRGHPAALRAVIINAYAAGRYGVHYRDETTNRPLKFSSYPKLVIGGGSGITGTGGSSIGQYTPNASGASPPIFDSPHGPSMGYMAYLLTGWNYHLEETQLLATMHFLKNNDSTRQETKGIIETSAGANTPRGAAWALRTLAQAAVLTPDDDPLRAEFVSSVNENIKYYHGRYVAIPNNPLGIVQPYTHYTSTDPWASASWMDDFMTGAFGYIKDLKAHDSAVQTQLDQFLTWKYKAVVGRLGGSGNDQYSYRYAAQYTVYVAPTNSPDYANGTGPWYANWGEVARAMGHPTSGNKGEPLESGYPTEPTSYWGNLMPAIAYAVDHGAAGALKAYNRILFASNWPTQKAGYDNDPVWGVKPRSSSSSSIPAVIANLQPGQWLELPNTKIRDVLPNPLPYGYPPNIVIAWNGGAVDSKRNRLLVWGGGHSDYFGNEVYALDLPSLSMKRITNPSPYTMEGQLDMDCGSALHDGTPTSRHTYDGLAYMAHIDKMLSVSGALAPCGYAEPAIWSMDLASNTWKIEIPSITMSLPGTTSAYDPVTQKVYVADQYRFRVYSPATNTFTQVGYFDPGIDYHFNAAIDPKRRKYVMIGDGVKLVDLVTGQLSTMPTSNAPAFVTSQQSPGVDYDPVADRIVAWHGGGNVYALNMDTGVWTQVATNAGPVVPAVVWGTFGRWGYVPEYKVFAMVNSIDQNAWVFKLK